MRIQYNGQTRYATRSAHYATAPELGTIIGPNSTGELLVVLGTDSDCALIGYATSRDVESARRRLTAGEGPRSLTERTLGGGR